MQQTTFLCTKSTVYVIQPSFSHVSSRNRKRPVSVRESIPTSCLELTRLSSVEMLSCNVCRPSFRPQTIACRTHLSRRVSGMLPKSRQHPGLSRRDCPSRIFGLPSAVLCTLRKRPCAVRTGRSAVAQDQPKVMPTQGGGGKERLTLVWLAIHFCSKSHKSWITEGPTW